MKWRFLILFFALTTPTHSFAQVEAGVIRNWSEERVSFWTLVYSTYDSDTSLIHDRAYPHIIYHVLKFKPEHTSEDRNTKITETMGQYREALAALASGTLGFYELSNSQWRVYNMFKPIREPFKYRKASRGKRMRIQDGRRDLFVEGVKRSGRFISGIRHILNRCGLPPQLISLIFVESLFYPKAVSKVGAAGLWQLMPSTAREFIKVSQAVDERYDPFLSTYAACQILKRNHRMLEGSWPLALTAYNHGLGGMMRASKTHGTSNLEHLIQDYESDTFQFASKNFYAQFLAAAEIYNHIDRYLGKIEIEEPLAFETMRVPRAIGFGKLSEVLGVEATELEILNPSLTRYVIHGKLPVPAGFPLRVPYGYAFTAIRKLRDYLDSLRLEARVDEKSVYNATPVPVLIDWVQPSGGTESTSTRETAPQEAAKKTEMTEQVKSTQVATPQVTLPPLELEVLD